jgi:hypothetical protein
VTPAVAAVGRIGSLPITGRALESMRGSTCSATWRTGRDAANALAGTTVIARRFAKLLKVTLRLLITVMLVTSRRLTVRK